MHHMQVITFSEITSNFACYGYYEKAIVYIMTEKDKRLFKEL